MEFDSTINELAMILVSVGKKEYSEDGKYDNSYVYDYSDDPFLDMSNSIQESSTNIGQGPAKTVLPIAVSGSMSNVIPMAKDSVSTCPVVNSSEDGITEKTTYPSNSSGMSLTSFTKMVCKLRRKTRIAIVKQRRMEGKIHIANSSPRYKLMQRSALKRERFNGRFN